MSIKIVPGQRWISDTEPELGLGTILDVDHHRVSLIFIASAERRTYAIASAPLTRVRFVIGDVIESVDNLSFRISATEETDGILTYSGTDANGNVHHIEEIDLNHFHQFNRPQDRLFSGKFDDANWYRLRTQTRSHWAAMEQSPVLGLLGPRTSLIPHQLYIAHEVASRHRPRVLLADEVGLGKTIEAGMILHHQILSGHVERILIIVPDALLHQWLLEMRRRFNINFSLFDEERCLQADSESNPFSSEQFVLASLDFLMDEGIREREVLSAGWDMVIVDEAHHLTWSAQQASPEYQFIEQLARHTPGMLLLTATPEQLGKASHFARLRLLDPDRFHDYEQFLAEERDYADLASVINHLLDDAVLDALTLSHLNHFLEHDKAELLVNAVCHQGEDSESSRHELIQLLLDRHGTGRVLFRNTRATVSGFPNRVLHAAPLPFPEPYHDLINQLQTTSLSALLHPESIARKNTPAWWQYDTRVQWLATLIKQLKKTRSKLLVICAEAQTAMDLELALRTGHGTKAAVFHEKLTLIQRDRSAAWFAQEDEGASVLICSEIGSEGRNFQFAHHLVLFDLPLNPDLLEQRIGRLDRIGQRYTIDIHLPYFTDSAQEVLFRWYHAGLNAFERHYTAGATVYSQMADALSSAILAPQDAAGLDALIEATQTLAASVERALHDGRDRLLEINSCHPHEAEKLMALVESADDDYTLWKWLESVFDAYGISVEEHSADCYILRPGEHLRVPNFPCLDDDGITVTLDRATALAREDMLYLTWEHPMVRGAMDLVLNGDEGNVCVSLITHPDLAPGEIILEVNHRIDCTAPRALQIARFLPHTLLTTRLDARGKALDNLDMNRVKEAQPGLDRESGLLLITQQRQRIEKLITIAEQGVAAQLPVIQADSTKRMLTEMTAELKRLAALRRVNPAVRQEEIDLLKEDAMEMHGCIQGSSLRLDSIHLMFCV